VSRALYPRHFEAFWYKPVLSPVNSSAKRPFEGSSDYEALEEHVPYRQAVGALMHLMVATRPDIYFAVGMVARYMDKPQKYDWIAAKRIFRYLQGTKSHGIAFQVSSPVILECFSDADWAGDLNDRKSTSGYVFTIAGGPTPHTTYFLLHRLSPSLHYRIQLDAPQTYGSQTHQQRIHDILYHVYPRIDRLGIIQAEHLTHSKPLTHVQCHVQSLLT